MKRVALCASVTLLAFLLCAPVANAALHTYRIFNFSGAPLTVSQIETTPHVDIEAIGNVIPAIPAGTSRFAMIPSSLVFSTNTPGFESKVVLKNNATDPNQRGSVEVSLASHTEQIMTINPDRSKFNGLRRLGVIKSTNQLSIRA